MWLQVLLVVKDKERKRHQNISLSRFGVIQLVV